MPSKRREIPFAGPAYQSANVFLNAQQCINYYLEPYPAMGENKFALRGCPGLRSWVDLGTNSAIRGLLPAGDYLFAVSGNKLFRITTGGTATEVTGSLNTSSGIVSMAENGAQVMIVDSGNDGYIYTISTEAFAEITDANFPGAMTVTFQDGFFVVNRPDTAQFWKSDLNDGLSWTALEFSTAAWKPDDLVAVFSDHRDLWLGGKESIELWYNNGSTTAFIFSRREGAEMEVGLAAKESFATIDNAVFWLGRDKNGQGQVFRAVGFQPRVVSTPPITEAINSYSDISDAIGISYLIGNSPMYEISFPTGDATWVFDSGINQWHERRSRRSSGRRETVSGRHRVQNHAFFADKHLMGDFENGKIYEHTRDVYKEGSYHLEATRSTMAFQRNQDFITINELQVLYTPGVGLVSGQGVDPVSMISWSGDGGFTWSNEHDAKIGKLGEYANRARITQLGQERNWVLRTKVTDPILRDILGAYADIEIDGA